MSSKYQVSNTSAFYNLAWISFAISFIGMVLGLIYLQMDFFQKAFIGMTYLFSISSCFVLAKVIRDKQEAGDYIKLLDNAKTEKMLSRYIGSEEM